MTAHKEWVIEDEAQLATVAREIMSFIHPGDIVGLVGELGAGKTTLMKYVAAAMGIREVIKSPTFTLMNVYDLPVPIHGISKLVHIDAYRLSAGAGLETIGFEEEIAAGDAVAFIEWPPQEVLVSVRISIGNAPESRYARRITIHREPC